MLHVLKLEMFKINCKKCLWHYQFDHDGIYCTECRENYKEYFLKFTKKNFESEWKFYAKYCQKIEKRIEKRRTLKKELKKNNVVF